MLGTAGCQHQAHNSNKGLLCNISTAQPKQMPLCLQVLPANQAGTRSRAVQYQLGQGVEVHLVSAPAQLPAALQVDTSCMAPVTGCFFDQK